MNEDIPMDEVPLGGIYVINLDARPERWDLFREGEENWKRAFGVTPLRLPAVFGVDLEGFDSPPWFRDRIKARRKNSWAGKAGCILSHRKAIQQAHEQGLASVLIVEDDAFITEEMAALWMQDLHERVASLPNDWAAIYLYTAKPFSPYRVVNAQGAPRIIETAGAFGCVAYIVNGRVFQKLLSALPEPRNVWPWVARYKAIDLWFSRNLRRFGKVYVISPSLIGHQIGPSDITMTPESEWTFDGELAGLTYTPNALLFSFKKSLRKIEWIHQESISFLRMQVKRVRGL